MSRSSSKINKVVWLPVGGGTGLIAALLTNVRDADADVQAANSFARHREVVAEENIIFGQVIRRLYIFTSIVHRDAFFREQRLLYASDMIFRIRKLTLASFSMLQPISIAASPTGMGCVTCLVSALYSPHDSPQSITVVPSRIRPRSSVRPIISSVAVQMTLGQPSESLVAMCRLNSVVLTSCFRLLSRSLIVSERTGHKKNFAI